MAALVIILVLYTAIESLVTNDYIVYEEPSVVRSNYKDEFLKLSSKVEEGSLSTGIPNIDNAGVILSDTITITPGQGDFANLSPNKTRDAKTYTNVNWATGWGYNTEQFTLQFAPSMLKNMTVYEENGVIKLFDKYIYSAMGSYWAHKFGLLYDIGCTFRITTDKGVSYDVIVVDQKSTRDAINTPDGKYSLAHTWSDKYCITELDVYNTSGDRWPVNPGVPKKHNPEIKYKEALGNIIKGDPVWGENVRKDGSLHAISAMAGSVVSIQLLEDKRVIDLLTQAQKESKELYGNTQDVDWSKPLNVNKVGFEGSINNPIGTDGLATAQKKTRAGLVAAAQAEAESFKRTHDNQKYINWYNSYQGGYGPDTLWCAMFVLYCLDRNDMFVMDSKGAPSVDTPSCDTMAKAYNKLGRLYLIKDGNYKPEPGDLILYNNGHRYNHVGIFVREDDKYIYTIEGNTSVGSSGSQSNGRGVHERKREKSWANYKRGAYAVPYFVDE